MKIPINEIKFEPTSGLDDVGKVFRWRNEIYRGIHREYSGFYKELLSSQLINELVEIGLVPTQITPFKVDGFDLILKHQTIPAISYANEWSSAMLKDAALLTCDIQLILLKSGYTLKDAHPYNILFDAIVPRFIDVGSIATKSPGTINNFFREFQIDFLYTLLLKYAGLSELVQATQLTFLGLPNRLSHYRFLYYRMIFLNIPMRDWLYYRWKYHKINRIRVKSPINGVMQLRELIEAIPVNSANRKGGHRSVKKRSFDKNIAFTAKMNAVDELLDKLQARSVLDICSNNGLFARMAESKGARVIACDIDESVLNTLYYHSKTENLNILPIRLDICAPTVAFGPWGMFKAAHERLKCELVMMLDVVPHLVQEHHRTFEDISLYLSSFTEKWVLVEFIGSKDKLFSSWDKLQKPEYNVNSFQIALGKYFSEVSVFRQIDDERWLIFCACK